MSLVRASFDVAASFVEGQVTLAIRGDVNAVSAPDLIAILDALIDRGHRSVVLDLAQTGPIDPAGMRVIVGAAGRLKSLGGQLAVRSPSALVRHILTIAFRSGQVCLETDVGRGDGDEDLA